jgi:ABC-2 type transport system ATP-binding protein
LKTLPGRRSINNYFDSQFPGKKTGQPNHFPTEFYYAFYKNLTKTFGNFIAVNNINLDIKKGELFGFLGPNGAGKTTTIKMITGLLSPVQGNIYLDGIDVWQNPIESKMKIGFIPDQPFLYDKLTGREFLYFSGGLYNLSKDFLKKKIDEMTDILKFGSWIDKRTEEYSQGMKQRITIASAFYTNQV